MKLEGRSKLPTPIFLDTNIFLYASGSPHPAKNPCLTILEQVAGGSLEATTNTEVLQELVFVLTRRSQRREALELASRVLALFPALLPVTRTDMVLTCDIVAQHPRLPVRDAVHAATMLNNGLKTIVSIDSDFDQIPGLERILPSSL